MQGCALVWMHATFCATSVVGSMVEVRMKGGTVYHLATHSSSFGFHLWTLRFFSSCSRAGLKRHPKEHRAGEYNPIEIAVDMSREAVDKDDVLAGIVTSAPVGSSCIELS